jgi:surface carbohydrate biosynthesis protein (TIGR04326 family)
MTYATHARVDASITAPGDELILWQGRTEEAPEHANVLLWKGIASHPGHRSLTEYLEDNGIEIRRRYLAWSFELGEIPVMGRALRERFRITRSESFWPLSMFVEQSTWKQSSLETILKLLAVEHLLESERPECLTLAGADRDMDRVLFALCKKCDIRYSWRRRPLSRQERARWRDRFPHTLQGIAACLYFPIRRHGLPKPKPISAGAQGRRVLICAPFINHTASTADAHCFSSKYWTELPQLLRDERCKLLWLHIFYPHQPIRTAATAAKVVRRIHADSGSGGCHGFVDAYTSVRGLLRVLWRWAALATESWLVGVFLCMRFSARPRETFWPLLRMDWARAFRGTECATGLWYLECFDQALANVARQDEGIYLMENQGWERALTRAWRHNRHGRLTGVAHSTLRFWDLRYHCDPRRYAAILRENFPAPDVVALNGAQARKEFFATCPQREPVVECEALRYLQLGSHVLPTSRVRQAGEPFRLLVLGDFLIGSTLQLLHVVAEALSEAGGKIELWIKAHPNCPVDTNWLPRLGVQLVDDSVATLAPQADMVLASNTTSAALEAFLSDVPVVVYDDRSGVNFSPLRSVSGVSFVHRAEELREVLKIGTGLGKQKRAATEFFHTDVGLPRWRAYFGFDR